MYSLLIAIVVFGLAGIFATVVLRRRPAAGTRLSQGLAHLAELRWREFTRLVLQAMQARGYHVLKHDDGSGDDLSGDGGDILLERAGHRVLLLCKYGTASVVGAQSILGLGKAAELRGAHAAMVVTPGSFDNEARRVAAHQQVELIDGASLWAEVEPFLGEDLAANGLAVGPPPRTLALAWFGAAAAGLVTWTILQSMAPALPAQASTPAPPAVAAADASPARPGVLPAQATPPSPANAVPSDPAALARRRQETANAISTLAGVDRAAWVTQSTLLVHLASEDADPSARLCPLLERYPELAASRVQLQPPRDSTRPVRFKQCQAY